ncbi:MAG: ABC transporter permease, partial [Anaeroplasmataceae bacterium]|nr:ABC transporter permease [Anaeroplasmataceae bacterium]
MKNKNLSVTVFFQLTKRHFLVFFKNKIRVFYTMIVPFILIAVYICFLRTLELSTVQNMLYEFGLESTKELDNHIHTLIDSWMMSGLIAFSTITISIQTNNIIINDKETGVNRDFASSPIGKNSLIASYFLFNFIVTLLICLFVWIMCLFYLFFMGEFVITIADLFMMVFMIAFACITSTLLTLFICSFIKKEATLASIIAILSAVVGFLIGVYMPLSMFPVWVRNICSFIPGTYSCNLLRFSFLNTPIKNFIEYVSSSNISNKNELIEVLTNNFGYSLYFFNTTLG